MLRYGIPDYRLPQEKLDRDIEFILSTGIEVHTDTAIGRDIEFSEIENQYDAVYISIGAHNDKKIGIDGENSVGVHAAVQLLRDIGEGRVPDFRGKRVCVIGGGSNLLVRDGGVPGVVIRLDSPGFRKISFGENTVTCGAGVKNAELKKIMLDKQFGGLEFLCSIPGVVGGSVKTNAGCFGREVADVMQSAEIMNGEGKIQTVTAADLGLSYRSSFFPDDWIILSITFRTSPDSTENIRKKLDEQKAYRMKNQPYNQKTAGSTFKNPEGLRAWELIKKSGCAGLQVGGAKVSDIHCNFLINTGKATAADIEKLGETIIKKAREETTVTLEWEIKRLGINK